MSEMIPSKAPVFVQEKGSLGFQGDLKVLLEVDFRAGGTGGAGGAIAPPVFFGERTKIYLDIALATMAAIHHAPPEFSTSRRPCVRGEPRT